MTAFAMVYAVFGDVESARTVARRVVEERLAACANILSPTTSVYHWDGALRESAEIPVLFKTCAGDRYALIARIAALHSYEVPAILSWPIDVVHPPYAAWLNTQVS